MNLFSTLKRECILVIVLTHSLIYAPFRRSLLDVCKSSTQKKGVHKRLSRLEFIILSKAKSLYVKRLVT